jgi:pantothenate kinase type III
MQKIISNSAMDSDVAFVDIGNSRLKIKFRQEVTSFDFSSDFPGKFNSIFCGQFPQILAYSSVNSSNEALLAGALPDNCKLINISEMILTQKFVDFSEISGIGSDRALGLIGALELAVPPIITVDCGTATTVNALDDKRKCRGGIIMPGLRTQAGSLARSTAKLPAIEPFTPALTAGRDTDSAIASGVVRGSAHAVAGIIGSIIREEFAGQMAEIVVTGGFAGIIARILTDLGIRNRVSPDLILIGIEKVFRGSAD